jgi:hypothetical protein
MSHDHPDHDHDHDRGGVEWAPANRRVSQPTNGDER